MSRRFFRRNYDYQARHFYDLPGDVRDRVADRHSDRIYYCPECDEEHPHDSTACPRYPAEHDESGYMGTGEGYPEDVRQLARVIASDS